MTKYLSILAAGLLAATAVVAQDQHGHEATEASSADAIFAIDTPTFVKLVTSSNEFEIQSSKLAEQKAQKDDIKEFAKQMVADHTKAGEELKAALQKGDAQSPAEVKLAPKHAGMLKLLEGAEGADFEMLYLDMQATAHMEAVSLFRTYSKSGDNQAVQQFAEATLPTLVTHKQHVMDIVAEQ